MRKRKVWIVTMCLLMAISMMGCQNNRKQAENADQMSQLQENKEEMREVGEEVSFTDDLGREVRVQNPQRVAALLGSYADIWYLAGGEVYACADDAWEDFMLPMPENAVNLGMTKELSLEKLFEADPDFILASVNTRQNMEWKDIFEEAGMTVAYFDVSDFEDYVRVLEICTKITGREDLYEQNGLAIRERIENVKTSANQRIANQGKAPTALVVRASANLICAKNSEGNVLGEMVAGVGCINIADSNDSLLESLSMEYIIKEDPDYIFFAQYGDDKEKIEKSIEQFIAENPAWKELTAVREGRVYIMEKELYTLKPNDRWGEAYEKLEAILAEETK